MTTQVGMLVAGIRNKYESLGVVGYYETYGDRYRNPHEATVRQLTFQMLRQHELDSSSVLDLACGSGEVTCALAEAGVTRIDGVDPYTGEAYRERTGTAAMPLTFEQVALGALAGREYSLIVCSFALHLVERSWLPLLLHTLSGLATTGARMLVITPHKRPEIRPEWGWILREELMIDRVRARLYQPQPAQTKNNGDISFEI